MSSVNQTIEAEMCALMREQRRVGISYCNIAQNFSVPLSQAIQCIRGTCDCCIVDVEPVTDDEPPWRETEVITHLFLNEGLPYTEMAKIFGCHSDTTRNWVMKLGLNVVEPEDRTSSAIVTKLQRIAKQEERQRQLSGEDDFETSPLFSRRIRHSD
mgnify:CR=1 FL=1